jgi:hypothetical protein
MATVFFSYSHRDETLRDELEVHLALLKHQGLIEAWHDRRIVAGEAIDAAIDHQLEAADIILLLVSADFIASAYCYSREMKRALERHAGREAQVIPVILRHCDWHSSPFGVLKAVPRDGRPVTAWPDRDEAFADVARELRRLLEQRRVPHAASAATSTAPSTPAAAVVAVAATALPRSSNLRLKKTFTDQEQDEFLRETFEFVCRFFEGSLGALHERNPEVSGTVERIDTHRMAALLYRNGKKITECSIRLDGLGRGSGIAFSHNASTSSGSYNEMLTVEATDQSLYLKTLGLSSLGGSDKHLSQEGAAELLWDLFIRAAQR